MSETEVLELRDRIIELILDSPLNIDDIPDDVEREMYEILFESLHKNRGCLTRLCELCCRKR